MTYGTQPIAIAEFVAKLPIETMSYQYMLIKAPGHQGFKMDDRLDAHYSKLVSDIACDYVGKNGVSDYMDSYMYITAKCLYSSPQCPINRAGWHCDGFGSNDINYIWCDSDPTEFMTGNAQGISGDHTKSMSQFDALEQLGRMTIESGLVNVIYRLDPFCIHRVSCKKSGFRRFVKVSFSKDRYNLIGNTINRHMDYSGWKWSERKEERNDPASK